MISARERSLESLRSILETTKQFYEERMSEAAESLSAKDAEVKMAIERMKACLLIIGNLQSSSEASTWTKALLFILILHSSIRAFYTIKAGKGLAA